jgi:hypothetical protein
MKTGPKTYTGEGGGVILLAFQGGVPFVNVTPVEVPEHPPIDFEKAMAAPPGMVFREGPRRKKHWEDFWSEMAVRDQGARGLPIDHTNPKAELAEFEDIKLHVSRDMLSALHRGDADYFERLSKALRAYDAPGGRDEYLKHKDIHPARAAGIEAIRKATAQARREPFVEEVKAAYGSTGTNSEFRKQVLIPLGFGWLKPAAKRGAPKKRGK